MTASAAPITAETTVRRPETAIATEVDGDVVVMSIEQGRYFTLDAVGSDVWNRLAEPVRVDHLIAALAADYDGPPDIIRTDVLALLDQLAGYGLLEVLA